jgi:hypothetical protein
MTFLAVRSGVPPVARSRDTAVGDRAMSKRPNDLLTTAAMLPLVDDLFERRPAVLVTCNLEIGIGGDV